METNTDEIGFWKESALAREKLTLDQLYLALGKAETCSGLMKAAGVFPAPDLERVQASVLDLSTRIRRKASWLRKQARDRVRSENSH